MPSKDKSDTADTQEIHVTETEPQRLASLMSSAESRLAKRRERYRQWALKNKVYIREGWRIRHNARYETDAEFRERYKAYKRDWGRRNAEKKRAWTRRWQAANKEHRENYRLQYQYGITLEQYRELFAAQRGLCLLCNKPPTEKRFAVDHDHVTGRIRGLLHRSCNSTFRGVFGDDVKALYQAYMRFAEMTTHVTLIVEDRKQKSA